MPEFELIERIQARADTRSDVVLGIGDDAAVLQVPAGKQLVVAMDTLNADVHFPAGTAAQDIGWKALAVNLSDLAAMAAQPAWCTLSLSLPQADLAWLDAFLDGFLALAAHHGVALVGGDTTRGPLSVCVTVHGLVDAGQALRRDGATPGDDLWVSGTLGDAAAALAQWREGVGIDVALKARLDRPVPRVSLALALAGVAHSCIDVSDGLLADAGHLCARSGVGAEIALAGLPASDALRVLFDEEARRVLQATGGDDYELCFSAPVQARAMIERAAASSDTSVTRIGRIVAGKGVRALLDDGTQWRPSHSGYVHF
ncbi:thiamine-monophosphate kinase [Luteimonas cucumeris]|uniref:Thiamine-monophosphate kinase n=1 Tax=Luteimonas cucumeris TaxID=985012 RepID=A0A562L5K7_9GAMM|nr:thiamine-phosphate kinase [Luteimonas cucumeris]TWI02921.1 thiamine-monophosphate kinase [Luteimonas cucumeris]